jgi:hypothetical protein
MERMTAEQSLKREKTAPKKAVFFYSAVGVSGTGGKKPATPPHIRRHGVLIKTNKEKTHLL